MRCVKITAMFHCIGFCSWAVSGWEDLLHFIGDGMTSIYLRRGLLSGSGDFFSRCVAGEHDETSVPQKRENIFKALKTIEGSCGCFFHLVPFTLPCHRYSKVLSFFHCIFHLIGVEYFLSFA